ncbi:hypothetical protein PoB_000465100 [Plakobranchus ocellatus]|uniref:Uncharacterized protein n=1 Tax=Plakobranchus ocellatus TaxID=259542 RepID=A0AAV3Y6V2_9GAST|nr:hypothetical protein PoB_000465100 [Plakobranchus ocellatus]
MASGASLILVLVSSVLGLVTCQQGLPLSAGYPANAAAYSGYPAVYGSAGAAYPGYSTYGGHGRYGGYGGYGYGGAVNPLLLKAYGGFAPVPNAGYGSKYTQQKSPFGSSEYYLHNSPLVNSEYLHKDTIGGNTKYLNHRTPHGSTQYHHQITPFGKTVGSKQTFGYPGFPGYVTVKTETTKHYGYPLGAGYSPLLAALHPARFGTKGIPQISFKKKYPSFGRSRSSKLRGY